MASEANRLRVAILGASGYTGGELMRLLVRHATVEIALLTADRRAGEAVATVFPHLASFDLPDFVALDEVGWSGSALDVVFCALPHGATHAVARRLLGAGRPTLIDLSPDFRLDEPAAYARWYGQPHGAGELQERAVYGLSELARERISQADLVACPGCYPTSALLPLVPLIGAGLIERDDIIIDAKSGVSGAGRGIKEASLFAEVGEGIHAYGLGGHRHVPEIEQELGRAAGGEVAVNFTPHLMPMNRGLLATIYLRLSPGASVDALREALRDRYAGEPFVQVVPAGAVPATRHVRGSNNCLIGVFEDRLPGRAVVLSVIDNLVKGASGQAVQNMNIACGLPETTALEQAPLFP